jgi:hypothetical protein
MRRGGGSVGGREFALFDLGEVARPDLGWAAEAVSKAIEL